MKKSVGILIGILVVVLVVGFSVKLTGYVSQGEVGLNIAGSCGDGICSGWESNADCSADCAAAVVTPPPSGDTGGGGGGGGVPTVLKQSFEFDSPSLTVQGTAGESKIREIKIKNTGKVKSNIKLSIEGDLVGLVSLDENYLELGPLQTAIVKIKMIFSGDVETSVFKIKGESRDVKKTFLLMLNSQSKESLFDVSLSIPKTSLMKGENVKAQFDFVPIGEKNINVSVKYLVKDSVGKVYYEENDTLFMDEQKSFLKEFDAGVLDYGDYILSLEMTYLGGFGSASSHFEVKSIEKPIGFIDDYYKYLIVGGLVLIVIFFAIYEFKKTKIFKRKVKYKKRKR